MAEKLDPKETTSIEELVVSNVYTQEALINVLVNKGLITRDEIIREIRKLKEEATKRAAK